MKQYKLVRCYPQSKIIGSIITFKQGVFFFENGKEYIHERDVVGFPEFWEEVVEKGYEILSFMHPRTKYILKKWDNHLFGCNYGSEYEDALLQYPNKINDDEQAYLIHSVRRLSDGQVFTIGDHINMGCHSVESGVITGFKIDDKAVGGMYIQYRGDKLSAICSGSIMQASPCRKLLLTTEDGVEIFEGDSYYYTDKYFVIEDITSALKGQLNLNDKHIRRFSTKAEAEKYVINNKPCLSLNDMLTLNGNVPDLKKFIKSKLGFK